MSGYLYDGQYDFRTEYSCESHLVSDYQIIAYSLDEGVKRTTIIINFSKKFNFVPRDRLLTKIAAIGLYLRVVVWV